ncbi:hypothetical protein [Corynebacterium jeikeium]|uniref:hypothetical protein n=1 Tax=Corynebacterium jeikeium TaxID=38289 RepID=UPI00054D4E46|nr:hypothetical protein [Corynebacterium jeikeium]
MSTKSDSIENGGHMAGPSADTEADAPILPPLEELFGNEAQDLDDLFNAMLDVAVDPNTEMPEGDLIPDLDSFPEEGAEGPSADEASHEVDLADLDDSDSLVDDATSAEDLPSDASGDDVDTGAAEHEDLDDLSDLEDPTADLADPVTDPVADPAADVTDYGEDDYGNDYGDDHPDDLTDLSGM